ncbi:MAG TPA: hypothetical protein VNA17_08660 [Pyrinomonadaceae bacterium]|nr:hypothetical protein [Pyrinomonadaceae bacterium]
MNEEYLWDKTGDDAEIESLEAQLAVFRYEPTASPALAENSPASTKSYRAPWALGFAFAAMAVVAGVSLWSMLPSVDQESEVAVADAISGDGPAAVEAEPPVAEVVRPHVFTEMPSAEKVQPKTYTQAKRSRKVAETRSAVRVKQHPVELTPEERAAYDQVVLALSITSSKLKMVQDKVNGDRVAAAGGRDNK